MAGEMCEFLAADWPAPANVVAGTTLRHGGVSRGVYASLNLASHVEDDPELVLENRRRVARVLELPGEPHWLRQVHEARVAIAPFDEPLEADASVTAHVGVVCAVLTADCLPVLVTDREGSVVAAVHAGWRGLSAGVIGAAVARVERPPEALLAWLGPAISQAAFEVGGEVRDRFLAADADASACFSRNSRGRWQADLYGLARRELARCGVADVFGGQRCTYAESASFFSYRRDGNCGRMASLIYLRE